MNRIVIIGNGFDLAHGMETRYSDFVLQLHKDVLKECFEKGTRILEDKEYSREVYYHIDELFEIEIPKQSNIIELLKKIISIDNLGELIESLKRIDIKFTCFSKLLNSNESLWFNFEKDYFHELSKIFSEGGDIEKLNTQFSSIRKRLIKYIESKQIFLDEQHFEKSQVKKLLNHFVEKIGSTEPNNILFLSFNYTRTLGEYFHRTPEQYNPKIIYIHGNINSTNDEVVFGYDNDRDTTFNNIMNGTDTKFLNFIKSVLYSNNENYNELDEFIRQDIFEIQIFGHSCGVSDFSILRYMFENQNCRKIKIFYNPEEGSSDYTQKVQFINLMIENKDNKRKIIPLSSSNPMPQILTRFKIIE